MYIWRADAWRLTEIENILKIFGLFPPLPLSVLRTVGRLKAPLFLLQTAAFMVLRYAALFIHTATPCVYLTCVKFFQKNLKTVKQNPESAPI